MANKFLLKGNGVEVEYTIGANPALIAMTVSEGGTSKSFKPADITTDQTGLGTLVSVAMVRSIDTGGSRFGFFLPELELALGQKAPVSTTGITETFSGPDSFPRRPTTWRCVHLHGTAEEVVVPLDQAVSA